MNLKHRKMFLGMMMMSFALVTAAFMLSSCRNVYGDEQNLTICLPPLQSSGRAILADRINGLKKGTKSYRVIIETRGGERYEKSGNDSDFTFTIDVNTMIEIIVECLDENGEVLVRAKKSHIVVIGKNEISMSLLKDGEEPLNINMVSVPGGTFKMGQDGDNATNVRNVTVSSFFMSSTEITQKQWILVVGNNGYGTEPSASYGKGDKFPMYYVSWYDALVFCNKLSIKEGKTPCYTIKGSTNPDVWGTPPNTRDSEWNNVVCDWIANGYRLPTEAEWEYAARSGNNNTSGNQYGNPATESTLGEYAWFKTNANGTTHQVKGKKPNSYGLYDMHGNVSEWCWDWYAASYDTNDTNNPKGATSGQYVGQYRVGRGGNWDKSAEDGCRVAVRSGSNPEGNYRQNFVGFRVVCK